MNPRTTDPTPPRLEYERPATPGADAAGPRHDLKALSQPLEINQIVASAGYLSTDQLVELLAIDHWDPWLRGERVEAEAYLALRPDLRSDDKAVDLVYGEFIVREEIGDSPALDEYLRRFPE
jgi:hypothetical protein